MFSCIKDFSLISIMKNIALEGVEVEGIIILFLFFFITVIDLLFGQNYFFGKFLVIEHFTCLVYLYMDIGFLGHVLSSWTAWFYSISPSEQNMPQLSAHSF